MSLHGWFSVKVYLSDALAELCKIFKTFIHCQKNSSLCKARWVTHSAVLAGLDCYTEAWDANLQETYCSMLLLPLILD